MITSSSHLKTNTDTAILSVAAGRKTGRKGRLSSLMATASNNSTPAVVFTALAGVAIVAVIFYGASRKKKHALSPLQWKNLFTEDGRLHDGGIKFLKRVRNGGVDPRIRAEVWPFLLGVYDFNSTKDERDAVRTQNRKQYERLRRQCRKFIKRSNKSRELNDIGEISFEGGDGSLVRDSSSSSSDDAASAREFLSSQDRTPEAEHSDYPSIAPLEDDYDYVNVNNADVSTLDTDVVEGPEVIQTVPSDVQEDNNPMKTTEEVSSPFQEKVPSKLPATEDFSTWQRIIRLDALRANAEWMAHYPSQAATSDIMARRTAEAVGLEDYGHLEAGRIFHAARLVAILEAYALYDIEIGYCQGMSDLLSPIVSIISDDHEAFWCFVGFMKKARQNFRLDEVGIRRQLDLVAKIIKYKDAHLFRHLEKLQAEDCFFVYRMVVVLFRRELTFEQTLCLWEVMWADQAAIRAGIGISAWSKVRQRAPPTDDLLLYAIAASVLQRRKLIIEKYSSMDEIIRECNNMSGQLDVLKLLDDAHNLVVTLRDKIETSL
ncbi:rab GTPase-activating protein 22-like [Cicer arietinum]|uniref:GTPase-activating protein gyp7-like n=1 Tax=Cicer arietinum TaxID=3827 RepID=A0A1S2Y4P5_CICAR|nr:GTPase-activating protein gyp7-like [Cicer arietinum]